MYSLPVSFFICIVCGNLFTLLYCMWVYHCLSNLLLIDTWIVSSVGVMSNAAINSLVHIFGVYTLFSMGYIPAFLPLKKFRGEIEMLTSQKCGTTWPFDSLKKKVKLKSSLWPNNSTPGYLSKRNENISPQKPATKMFFNSFIHNNPKLEAVQVSIKRRMDKQAGAVHTVNTTQQGRKQWGMDMDKPPKRAEWPKHLSSDRRPTWRNWRGSVLLGLWVTFWLRS